MLKQPNNFKKITLLILFNVLFVSCTNKKNDEHVLPNPDKPAPQNKTIGSISRFETQNFFWNFPRKIKTDKNSIFSLIYTKENPESKIQSQLSIYNTKTQQYVTQGISSPETIMDFDITSDGKLVQLISTEIKNPDFEELPLRELSIYVDQKKIFTFHDSKLNEAIKYDENGVPQKAYPIEKNTTLFFVSSPLTEFARLQVLNGVIYLSAVGTFGFKIFAFNFKGEDLFQTEVIPQSVFNTVLVDKEAPYFKVEQNEIFTAITISKNDLPIYNQHFQQELTWSGSLYQVIFQKQSLDLQTRLAKIVSGSGNFFTNGFCTNEKNIAVYGGSGGAGFRQAIIANLDRNLITNYKLEFSPKSESDIYTAIYRGDNLIVGGSAGSKQVSTGSVVEYSDAFILSISHDGSILNTKVFGTQRNDRITAFSHSENTIYLTGFEDGPITHTTDNDKNQGFQNWFWGQLNE